MKNDQVALLDTLNRMPYASKLALDMIDYMSTNSQGITIAITGKWGTGKSTFIGFLKERIDVNANEKKIMYRSIDFNPWMFADDVNIQHAFLKGISNELTSSKNKLWKKFLSHFSKAARQAEHFNNAAGKIGNKISDLISDYLKLNNSLAIKKEIDKLLEKSNIKLLVYIDDIDRLYPKQIYDLLQVIKLIGAFKNTYYILAFDREAVELAIENQFKEYSRKYLDKIIQIDYILPDIPKEKLEEVFFDELSSCLKSVVTEIPMSELTHIWKFHQLSSLFTTLRDLNRFFNSFKFRINHIKDDVHLPDLIILEAIRLADYNSYVIIYQEYDAILSTISSTDPMYSEKILKKFENPISKKLVQYLFPSDNYKGDFYNQNTKRLYTPDCFYRYFTLAVNSKDVSEDDLRAIISVEEKRIEKLKSLLDFGRAKNLFRRLTDTSLLTYYPNVNYSLALTLFNFFDRYAYEVEEFEEYVSNAILNLITINEKTRKEDCEKFLNNLLSETGKLSLGRQLFLHFIVTDEKINTGFARSYYFFKDHYMANTERTKQFYFKYLSDWKNYYLTSKIPKPDSYFTFLFIYDYALFYLDDYIDKLPELLKSLNNLLFFVRRILAINSLDGMPYRIDTRNVNVILPSDFRDSFITSLSNIEINTLDNSNKLNIEFILTNKEEFNNIK